METSSKPLGREYLRVSQDRSGRARSVDEQHEDNQRAAESHGFRLNGEAYSDVSLSASRFATRTRGDFARLMRDLESGTFGADILVLWESSRGSRKVGEWATLLDVLEAAGVRVFVTTHQRFYDPAHWRDRKSLLEDAVDNEADSAKKSDAVRRAAAATAARGEPHGRIPYGYRRRYDPVTRRLVAQEPDAAEAPVVAELFARLAAGHSIKAVARDFAARGITTRTGKPWTPEHLRCVALRPVYGGLRVHEPGTSHSGRPKSLEGAVKATWPPLVDAETFYAVRNLLTDPSRRTSRPGRAKHLLSLIARCGACGGHMSVTYRRGWREYACRDRSCVRIPADGLDRHAEAVFLAYLAREDVIAQLRDARGEQDGELAAVRADLAATRAELDDWRARARAGQVTAASFAAIEPGIVERITAMEAREAELALPPALSVIPPGADVAGRWDAAPMSARRQVARMLCTPPLLGTLLVDRSPKPGHTVPAEDRVRWERGDDTE